MRHIDAHQHYWSVAHHDYGWLSPALAPIYRDFTPADLHPWLDAAGIEATVLVQAAPSAAETTRLVALAAAPGSRVAGVVGWCDLAAADAAAAVARRAAEPLIVGLRPMLQDLPDPRWILQDAVEPALQAMVQHGLCFDALVRTEQIDAVRELALRHPGLRVVLDHAAKPAIAGRAFQPWARHIARLARDTAVCCKLSGLVTEAGPGWTVADLQPYVEHLLAEFGPQRLLWGSDWPVLRLAGRYADWVQASDRLLQGLDDAARAAVMGANAIRFYGLDGRAGAAVPGVGEPAA